ncbi:MAG: DUF1854 domain-containing protein [Ruminococcaceae bacterium]|nr:DUF1854 domain-containing protein [Oscillospiraceae bacterium]
MSKQGERIYVSQSDTISLYENNLVTLSVGSESYKALEPRRLFPVSRADSYISLLNEEGEEIALIRSLNDLNRESRDVVEYSLNDYYLVPHITRILSVSEKNGKIHWSVETDRGFKEFDVRNRNHDVKVYDDGRVRVRDSDDNRYVIFDYHKLDKHSRNQLIADL